jgi:hypothetical protein
MTGIEIPKAKEREALKMRGAARERERQCEMSADASEFCQDDSYDCDGNNAAEVPNMTDS